MEITEKGQEVKEKILNHAEALFMRYGVRSVTMDDVAREVGVSKKTLYQFFDNKEDLVTGVAQAHLTKEKGEYDEIEDSSENAIAELVHIASCMRKNLANMNPSLLYDLQKYHHTAWEIFLDFKNNFIRGHIERNLKRGIEQGYYRDDLDPEILSAFRVEQVQMTLDGRIFPPDEFDLIDVQLQLFNHFVHGVLSDKGRTMYAKYHENN